MLKQTKLINCGNTTIIYNFNAESKTTNHLGIEQGPNGMIGDLKRTIVTNFSKDKFFTRFLLKFNLADYKDLDLENKLTEFINSIKKSSDYSTIKYFAFLELSVTDAENYAYLHCVTDVEARKLTNTLEISTSLDEDEIRAKMEMETGAIYFEELWGNEVSIDVYFPDEFLHKLGSTFGLTFLKSIERNSFKYCSKLIYKSPLQKPLILWNEEAEKFIQMHSLLDYPVHYRTEFYDSEVGFAVVNVYSLDGTRSLIDKLISRAV